MGVQIDALPHHCGSRRGLKVFAEEEENKVTGYCFSCQQFVRHPYGDEKTVDDVDMPEPKSQEQIEEELAEVSGYDVVDVRRRKLRADDLRRFGIKTALSETDGKTPTHMYFPMTIDRKFSGYYVKTLSDPSYQYTLGEVKGADLFNWDEASRSGAYRLIIVEGREDAVATDKIYRQFGKEEYHPAIVALPNGTNSVKKCLGKHAEDIKRLFREVIICFDDDRSGKEATEEAMLILPQAKSVSLPCKDPNDCILEGRQKAAYKAFAFDAHKPKNTRLVFGEDLHEAARNPTPYGELTWPFPDLDKLLRGVRYGETVYIGAGVKMGKSELLNAIAAHFIKEHQVPVFMAKPEEENKKTYKMMCNKMVGKVFTDPDVEFDYEAYDRAGDMLKGKLMMVNLYQHLGWESLRKDIVAAASQGAKAVFIDPITNLTNGANAADANTELAGIAQDLSAMALDLNIVVFIFCHLKAPDGNLSSDQRAKKYKNGEYINLGNCPHEFGGTILSAQFAGSRAMMRSCNLMLGLEGNKDPELDDKTRNMRWLSILEDREFGNSARIPLYWNKNSTLFKQV